MTIVGSIAILVLMAIIGVIQFLTIRMIDRRVDKIIMDIIGIKNEMNRIKQLKRDRGND
jgi:hypothetical protein